MERRPYFVLGDVPEAVAALAARAAARRLEPVLATVVKTIHAVRPEKERR